MQNHQTIRVTSRVAREIMAINSGLGYITCDVCSVRMHQDEAIETRPDDNVDFVCSKECRSRYEQIQEMRQNARQTFGLYDGEAG